MRLCRHIITLQGLVALFIAHAGEPHATNVQSPPPPRWGPDLEQLQGTWIGVREEGVKAQEKVTITISGSSFHFHRDTNFWFETTITLPAGTDPKQLHATIRNGPPSQASSIGQVVGAIYKIEDGTLTLVDFSISDEPPITFADAPARYVVKRVQPPGKSAAPPKSP